MSIKNQRLIQIASENARLTEGDMKHCAMLVRGGKIIKKSRNNLANHAESAIVRYLIRIRSKKSESGVKARKFDLYVCRVNGKGVLRNSKPCYHCLEEIKKTNMINRIVYSDFDFNEMIPYSVSEKIDTIINTHISFGNKKM